MPYLVGLCYQKVRNQVPLSPLKDVSKTSIAEEFCRHLDPSRPPQRIRIRFADEILKILSCHNVNLSQTISQAIASGKGTMRNVLQTGLIALSTDGHGGAQAKVMPMVLHLIAHLGLKPGEVPTRAQLADWAFARARYIDYVCAKLINDDLKLAIVREDSLTEHEIEAMVAVALPTVRRK